MTKSAPFKYFNIGREIFRLAVMLYIRFPLSLRNVEYLLHERGVDPLRQFVCTSALSLPMAAKVGTVLLLIAKGTQRSTWSETLGKRWLTPAKSRRNR